MLNQKLLTNILPISMISPKMREMTGAMLVDYNDVPALYELGTLNNPGLKLSMSKQLLEYIQSFTDGSPMVEHFIQDFNLQEFTTPNEGTWGFGPIMTPLEEDRTDWLSWECHLPRFNGKSPKYDFMRATSASLYLVVNSGNYADFNTNSDQRQLFSVDMALDSRMNLHSCDMFARLAKHVMPFFKDYPEWYRFPQIEEAMKKNFFYMNGRRSKILEEDILAAVLNRGLFLRVPGDACEIGVDGSDIPMGDEGVEMPSHNVDTPIQQLTLLTGIAAFHDLARQAGF